MTLIEAAAAAVTVVSVILTVRRSLWQYPVGLCATALYLVVFWQVRLYASASLQVVFMAVQLYGWWFWLHGGNGARPPIRSWSPTRLLGVCLTAVVAGGLAAYGLARLTDAQLPLADSLILGLSLGTQFLLDRKVLEHWIVWAVVNVLSIIVYGAQGLSLTSVLYAGLLLNTAWGWWVWRRAYRSAGRIT
ncbi:MAG: nicotinamide riboside transporter PnuC [Brevundimonas sp.]|nr:MAG: nicotinamide riboside transporter PnuC [Brevundimonas sp.]